MDLSEQAIETGIFLVEGNVITPLTDLAKLIDNADLSISYLYADKAGRKKIAEAAESTCTCKAMKMGVITHQVAIEQGLVNDPRLFTPD